MSTQGAFGLLASSPITETRSAAAASPSSSAAHDPCLYPLQLPLETELYALTGSSAQHALPFSEAFDVHYAGAWPEWQPPPKPQSIAKPLLPKLEACSSRSLAYDEAGIVLRSVEESAVNSADLIMYLGASDVRWRSVLLGRMADEEFEIDGCLAKAIGELLSVNDADLAQAALLALRFGGSIGVDVLRHKLASGRMPFQVILEQLAAFQG